MAKDIKSLITRSPQTVLSDVAGVAAIAVMFYAAMVLPGVF
ncbi:hypothetical protein [Marivivens donghaensis]|nr:hypothetical protein [Marivivens donghaensis]